jgi:hypothetical protein
MSAAFSLYPSSGCDLGFCIPWQWPYLGVSPGHWSTLSGFSQYHSIGLSLGLHFLVGLFYSWNGTKLGFLWLVTTAYQKCYCEVFLSWWVFQTYKSSIMIFWIFSLKQVWFWVRFEVLMEVTQMLPFYGKWGNLVRGYCLIYICTIIISF